jgi:hypothetical protein
MTRPPSPTLEDSTVLNMKDANTNTDFYRKSVDTNTTSSLVAQDLIQEIIISTDVYDEQLKDEQLNDEQLKDERLNDEQGLQGKIERSDSIGRSSKKVEIDTGLDNSQKEYKKTKVSQDLRNSKEEKRFQVGSISTERQFPNGSKLSLMKLFDSPLISSPKPDENIVSQLIVAAPKHPESAKRMTFRKEKEVLIGTPVKEGHANYVLMYDMLTGIRISVRAFEIKI